MKSLMVCSLAMLACALAAPTSYTAPARESVSYAAPAIVAIVRQVQQLNDDGSYTFGYEAADGSYRVEVRDANNYIRGKYGYIDTYGKLQETEYVSGKVSGGSVGYQARGAHLKAAEAFPVIKSASRSSQQRALDLEWSSVDDDEDGIPDNLAVVRTSSYAQPAVVVVDRIEQPVVKQVEYKVEQPIVKQVQYEVIEKAVVPKVETKQTYEVVAPKVETKQAVYVAEPVAKKVETKKVYVTETVAPKVETKVEQKQIYGTGQTIFRSPSYEVQQPTVIRTIKTDHSSGQVEDFLRTVKLNRNTAAYGVSANPATPVVLQQTAAAPVVLQQTAAAPVASADAVVVDTFAGVTRII